MGAVLVIAAAIFVWGVVSARLERATLSAPIFFVAVGGILALMGVVEAPSAPEVLNPLVEITLVWVLFTDAAGVPFRDMRPDLGRYLRLLAIGLPLTMLLGTLTAGWLFPELGWWLALLIGAALAPTDAALGLPVVRNPLLPVGLRRLITVESGLNDGIATPVVLFAIAGAAAVEGVAGAPALWQALVQFGIGIVVGVAAGLVGGFLLRWARDRGWADHEFTGIAVLALAIVAYEASIHAGGNGFIAAFCGGLAFGASAGSRGPAELVFIEQASGLASLLIWLTFGAITLPILFDVLDWRIAVYAVLSLTLLRMLPVLLSLLGSGLDRRTALFIGWFGPRGLASLVFALIALEELPEADEAVAVIAVTVILSVLAHGLSASPLTARYAAAEAERGGDAATDSPDIQRKERP